MSLHAVAMKKSQIFKNIVYFKLSIPVLSAMFNIISERVRPARSSYLFNRKFC